MDDVLDFDQLFSSPSTTAPPAEVKEATPGRSAASASPEPSQPDVMDFDQLFASSDPGGAAPAKPQVAGKKAEPTHGAFVRGLYQGGVKQNLQAIADAAEMAGVLGDSATAQKLSDYLHSLNAGMAEGDKGLELQVPSMKDIHSLGDVGTYIGEQAGSALGSSGPSLAAGIATGAATSEFGPEVSIPAGLLAAGGMSYLQNAPSVYRDLLDAGVKDKHAAATWAMTAAAPIAAIDVWAEKIPLLKGLGAEGTDIVKRAVIKRIAQDAAKTAVTEGSGETVQQIIQDAAVSLQANKDFLTKDHLIGWADNFAGGAIGGAVTGGASGVLPDQVKPKQTTEGESNINIGEDKPTPPEASDKNKEAGQNAGTSTPGSDAPKVPPQATEGRPTQVTDVPDDIAEAARQSKRNQGKTERTPPVPAPETDDGEDHIEVEEVSPDEVAGVGRALGPTVLRPGTVSPDVSAALDAAGAPRPAAAPPEVQAPAPVPAPAPAPQPVEAPPAPPQVAPPEAPVAPGPVVQEPAPAAPAPVQPPIAAFEQAPSPAEVGEPVQGPAVGDEAAAGPAAPEATIMDFDAMPTEPAPAPKAKKTRGKKGAVETVADRLVQGIAERRGISVDEANVLVGEKAKEVIARRDAKLAEPVSKAVPEPETKPTGLSRRGQGLRAAMLDELRSDIEREHHVVGVAADEAINRAFAAADESVRAPNENLSIAEMRTKFGPRLRALALHEATQVTEEEKSAEAKAIGESTAEGRRKALEVDRKRRLQGAPQEKARFGKLKGKTAEEMATESMKRFIARAREEVKAKGEQASQRAKDVAALADRQARRRGKGAFQQEQHAAGRKELERLHAESVAEQEAKDALKPKPAPVSKEQEVEQVATAARLTKEERAEATERGRVEAADRIAKAQDSKAGEATKDIVMPEFKRGDTEKSFNAKVISHAMAMQKAIADALGVDRISDLPTTTDPTYSKSKNFLITLEKIVKGIKRGSQSVTDIFELVDNYKRLSRSEFANAVGSDILDRANRGMSDERVTQEMDAAADRFIDEKPAYQQAPSEDYFAPEPGEPSPQTKAEKHVEAEGDVLSNSVTKRFWKTRSGDKTTARAVFEGLKQQRDVADYLVGQGPAGTNFREKGLWQTINRWVADRLMNQFGDMTVYWAPDHVTNILAEAGQGQTTLGFYSRPSLNAVAQGAKGFVVLNERLFSDPVQAYRTLIHETIHAVFLHEVHAGTQLGNAMNLMYKAFKQQTGLTPHDHYGMTDVHEFMAEAFSNPKFQRLLAATELPAHIAETLGRHMPDKTYWGMFRTAVQHAIGMLSFGKAGRSYMDAVLFIAAPEQGKVEFSHKRAIEAAQRAQAKWKGNKMFEPVLERSARIYVNDMQPGESELARGPQNMAMDQVHARVQEMGSALIEKSRDAKTNVGAPFRRLVNRVKTLTNLAQDFDEFTNGPTNNPMRRAAQAILRAGVTARDKMVYGDQIIAKLVKLGRLDAKRADALSTLAHDATLGEYDPSQPLHTGNNRHIRKGVLDTKRRADHAKARAAYLALSPEDQALFKEIGDYYRDRQNTMTHALITSIVNEGIARGKIDLHKGETADSVRDWVMGGGAERMNQPSRRTSDDVRMAEQFGKTEGSQELLGHLRDATAMGKVKGYYVPLIRHGDYIVTAKKTIKVPDGARLVNDPQYPDSPRKNVLVFEGPKAKTNFQSYMKANSDVHTRKPRIWRTDSTGKRIDLDTFNELQDKGEQVYENYLVNVQDQHVQTFEKESEAKRAREELHKSGAYENVTQPQIRQNVFEASSPMTPTHVKRMINSVRQSANSSALQKQVEGAIQMAAIKQMETTSIQRRRQQRRGILGFSKDLAQSMRDYNVSSSNYITNLEAAPDINAGLDKATEVARKLAEDYTAEGRTAGKAVRAQELIQAFRNNIDANYKNDPSGKLNRMVNFVTTVSFLKYLASPSHSIINLLQPGMVTLPYLAARHGAVKGTVALDRAYSDLGRGMPSIGVGLRNIGRSTKRVFGRDTPDISPTVGIEDRVAKAEDGKDLVAMLQELKKVGLFADDAGLELDAAELGKTKMERAAGRASAIARAMPEAIEAINRAASAIAAYRLGRREGMDHTRAVTHAMDVVNNTQGDYSTKNAPTFMKTRTGRLAFQFKKYALMVSRILGKQAYAAVRGMSPEERKVARKQLMYMALTHGMIAGAVGLPFMELPRLLVTIANGMGWSDDDWDTEENRVQVLLKQILGGTASEALMRGVPRLVGANLSNRVGLDSLLTYGSPDDPDEKGMKAWLFDNLAGAPIGMFSNMLKGAADGDWSKALPWPKVGSDIAKAADYYQHGVTTKAGKQLSAPGDLWGTFLQAIGIQPAARAEAYETGGKGRARIDKAKAATERQTVMGRWLNVDDAAGRAKAWDYIRNWNKGKPAAQQISLSDLIRAKRRRESDSRREARSSALSP